MNASTPSPESAGQQERRQGLSPVLLSLAVAVLLLLGLELGSYLMLRFKGIDRAEQESHFQYYDGLCGWRYVTPHGLRWEDFSERYDTSTIILLDRWGFNTTARGLTLRKKPGEVRIAVTGGSATFGIGNQKPEWTIPSRLQAELRRRHPGRDIKVINACLRGYNSFQQFALYLSYLSSFSPDVVISFTGPNDLTVPAKQGPLGVAQPLKNRYMLDKERFVNRWQRGQIKPNLKADVAYYLGRTNTGRLFSLLSSRYGPDDWLSSLLAQQEEQKKQSRTSRREMDLAAIKIRIATYLNNMRDYRAAVINRGSHFLGIVRPVAALGKPLTPRERSFILSPDGRATAQTKQRRAYYRHLLPALGQVTDMYDLSGVFRGQDGKTLFVDASHYNPNGTLIIGQALADLLEAQPWFQELLSRKEQ